MPSQREIPLLLRRFNGVNLAFDSAFVDPAYLQFCNNWVPSPQYLLTKRQGTTALGSISFVDLADSDVLWSVYALDGNHYLYAATRRAATADLLHVFINDAPGPTLVGGGANFSANQRYGMAVLGNTVYIGNGLNVIKRIDLTAPSTTVDLVALSSFVHAPTPFVPTPDTASTLRNGNYSYRWVVYSTATSAWSIGVGTGVNGAAISGTTATAVSVAHTFDLSQPATSSIALAAPTAAERMLAATEIFKLFVAYPGLPIEFAHEQGSASGNGPGTTVSLNGLVANTDAIPLRGITRTGKYLVAHRNRLWVAGDLTNSNANTSKVYATSTILPGLEQALYNTGQFWPLNAQINVATSDGDIITGLSVAATTETLDQPTAPMLIFKNNSTWAFFGDIVNDPNATLVNLSNRIGCVSHRTITATTVGTIFLAHDSVYLVRPDTLIPVDIGWPIAPKIKEIPRGRRVDACAFFHRGFYKLAVSPAGTVQNTQHWWLDLRTGLGTTPSWWGPHTAPPYTCFASATRTAAEDDRGYAVQSNRLPGAAGIVSVTFQDQPNTYTELAYASDGTATAAPVVAVLTTKALDAQQPFQRKVFTRIRINGRTNADTTNVGVALVTNGGLVTTVPPLTVAGSTGSLWNTSPWNTTPWSSSPTFMEGESILPADRARGQYAEVSLLHNAPTSIDLRDFELRYIPVERPVQ